MAKFTALPVRNGDAFLLELDEGSVLVDGGISRSGFPGIFKSNAKTDKVDVLICTHNDADHANGVLGFLDSDLTCREVWLPDKWATLLPAVLSPLPELISGLVAEIRGMTPEQRRLLADSASPIEALGAQGAEPASGDESATRPDGWPVASLGSLDDAPEWMLVGSAALPIGVHMLGAVHFVVYSDPAEDQAGAAILNAALDVAKKIREIALLAYQRGINVRWFKFDPTSPGGGLRWLMPVNCQEVMQVRLARAGKPVLPLLALTTVNKESLAFWAPPIGHGGVHFSADTDLVGVNPLPLTGAPIVTVPHHGSEENAIAINNIVNHLAAQGGHPVWVRSDSRNGKRPGPTFIGLPKATRYCTICRNTAATWGHQAVRLESQSASWVASKGTNTCAC